jgi:DNA polymerase-3 subunit epsilon
MVVRIAQWLGIKQLKSKEHEIACGWKEEINEKLNSTRPQKLRGIPLNEIRFVVFDTETTGFHPKKGDELLSIGAVVLQNGEIKEERFHRFINPHRVVPRVVTELTGITQEQADAGEPAVVVIRDFLDFAGPCIFVGHSVEFDFCFLNCKLKQLGCQGFNHPFLDTYWLARAVYPCYADLSLDGLLKLYQLEAVGRHTALGDAILTAHVLKRLLDKLCSQRFYDYIDLRNYIQSHNMQQALTGGRNLGF